MGFRRLTRRGCAAAIGAALVMSVVPASLAASRGTTGQERAAVSLTSIKVYCSTPNPAYQALAAKMVTDIRAKIAARLSSTEGIEVTDSQTGITCWYRSGSHFYAASAIKATILAALLRKAQEQHRSLTSTEKNHAYYMITQSSNADASALWNELGVPFIQHFLNLAGMIHTLLNSHAWGLSLLTADDEIRLLKVLTYPGTILTPSSQAYELNLMANVIGGQRWGTPYGAPLSMVVHVKNGWLPYPGSQWEINSIGAFTRAASSTVIGRTYLMAILTYNNPSMLYGENTIQSIAWQVHHDWNAGIPLAPTPSPTATATSPSVTPTSTVSLPPATATSDSPSPTPTSTVPTVTP